MKFSSGVTKELQKLKGIEVCVHLLHKDTDTNYYNGRAAFIGQVAFISKDILILGNYNGEGKHAYISMSNVESIIPT